MKITISRLFETTKTLSTKAGREVKDFVEYMAQLSELTVRALRNGLTFRDNFSAEILSVTLQHGVALQLNNKKLSPEGIIVQRVLAAGRSLQGELKWFLDEGGNVQALVFYREHTQSGVSWSRATNVVTVSNPYHGLRSGDSVKVFYSAVAGANVAYGDYTVTAANVQSFTFSETAGNDSGILSYRVNTILQSQVDLIVFYP